MTTLPTKPTTTELELGGLVTTLTPTAIGLESTQKETSSSSSSGRDYNDDVHSYYLFILIFLT